MCLLKIALYGLTEIILQVLPYVLVLIGGIIGINVFVVLLTGIVSGAIIMLAGGHITPVELLTNMGSGVSGMFETCMVAILVAAMCALIREYGGFDALLNWIHKIFHGKKGGQLGMGLLVGTMDIATANNTVAIVMANPIAKEMAQEYGITPQKTPADSFAVDFLAKEYPLCHANQQARYNLLHGLSARESGYWKNNPHANCLDFQIEADFAGIVTPGMVNSAVDICDRAGHIMACGDGWYGGVYVAAMYSLAYVSNDVNFIVTEALKSVPAESKFHECMSDVICWHQQYPTDWKKCWQEIENKWGTADIACPDGVEVPFNIEAYVNGAYIVLGLLYGEGDFERTIDISTRAGQDSDCNPASSGGIIATMLGYNQLPEKYRTVLMEVADRPFNNTVSFNKGCELSYGQALRFIEREGGKVNQDVIEINYQEPKAAPLEISFEGLKLDKRISIENWVAKFPEIKFHGIGAVIKGAVQGENVPEDYVAQLEVYFNDKLVETCELPLKYNHRKHELFFNYEQPEGDYTLTCKWLNPVKSADIWVREVVTYTK